MVRHMTAREKFLAEIEAYLAATGMTPTDFGLAALNDGSFVGRVRDGRAPNLNTVERVRSWMASHPLDLRRAREADHAAA